MEITYIDKRTKTQLESEKEFTKRFGSDIFKRYLKFIEDVRSVDSLFDLQVGYRGYRVEKLAFGKNKANLLTWSARLNEKWRVNFSNPLTDAHKIYSICIIKVHPHKY